MANFYKAPQKKFLISFILFSFLALTGYNSFAQFQSEYFNVAGAGTWVPPCGVTSITVEAWGGGGSGGAATINGQKYGGGGGAGGAFARKLNVAVTPGTSYNYSIGAGGQGNTGSGNNGGDTWFINSTTVLAKGGAKGVANNGTGGLGTTVGSIGDVVYRGGHGYKGNGDLGAAGGGGAGNYADGGDATDIAYGVGGYAGGGDGGVHRTNNGAGNPGQYTGGGGAGARKGNGTADNAGGDGFRGFIKITYASPPPNYCPINFTSIIEPITLVNFAGINRTTSNTINGTPALEIFCDEGTVLKGNSYIITVKGNTNDGFWPWNWYTDFFTVFLDWNQDGDYDDAGERYEIGTIYHSDGNDSKTASLSITIPAGATLGKTKMRVVKDYDGYVATACGNHSFGQAEEYIINITQNCVAPTQALANGVSGTLTVCAGTQVDLTQAGGSSGAGNWIWSKNSCAGAQENANNNSNALYSFVPMGVGTTTYYVKASCGGGCASVTIVVTSPGGIGLTSAATTQNQDVCYNSAITPVVYTATGSPVSIALTSGSLPPGVSGNYLSGSKTYTISGTPNVGVTGTYNYTLTVSGNSPCSNTPTTISGSITVFSTPTLNYSNNTASYCTGGSITDNVPTIAGGPTATSYSVAPTLPAGLSLNTTTGVISGIPSTTQTAVPYTITANTNCGSITKTISIAISSGSSTFNILPAGTQPICSDSSVVITLSGSVNGEVYQLFRDGIAVGGTTTSTGGVLNFGAQSAAGTYTIATTTGCKTNMNGSTIINVTPVPTTQFTYPSYTFCKAGTSAPASFTGSPQTGTFSASPAGLVFANATTGEIDLNNSAINNYTITYTVPAAGSCSNYTFSRNIQILGSPNFFNVTGGGSYCQGGTGMPVYLSGSQSGVNYTLYRDGIYVGVLPGSGSSINFGNQTLAGTYTVFATLGGCTQQMDYEAIITVNPKPADIVITPANSTICLGNVVDLTATGNPPSSTNGSVMKTSGNVNLGIPDNNANGTFSLLRVTGIPVGATITGVSIKFNITHPYDGDLRINLKGPSNNVLNIANGIGGGGNNFINTIVNSSSVNNISSSGAPYTGTYAPQAAPNIAGATALNNNISNVSTFNGLYGATAASANGDWILSVRDKGNSDVGILNNWDITISYTVPGNATSVVWTPATDLFTDPGASTAYVAGSTSSTVYAKPTSAGGKTYTATVTNSFGCSATATDSITVNPSPVITVSADYCTKASQNLIIITATSSVPVSASSWTWSGGYTSTNTTTNSKIEVNTAGTFYVSAIASGYSCPGTGQISVAQELVVNGDFEQGNVGFGSAYTYVNNTTFNGLYPEQTYTVSSNPTFSHDNFWGIDHTTADGNGKYMLINGRNGLDVWNQTVNVLPNTIYYFSAWAVSLNNVGPFANLIFNVNGTDIGTPTGALPSKDRDNNSGNWIRFYGTWNSGANSGPVVIKIRDLENSPNGNDFGIDDISFATLSSFFNLTSAANTDHQTNVCQGQPINNIEYEVGGDGAAPVMSSGFSLPPGVQTYWNGRNFRIYGTPTAPGTYNYEYKINVGSACGPRTKSGQIIVIDSSKAGTFTAPILSTCYGGAIDLATNLSGTVGTTVTWYSSTTGNPGSFNPTIITNPTNITGEMYYTVTAQNTPACLIAKSDTILVGVKNLWVGNSNNWNDPNNWSDKQLPTTGCDDVVIPQVTPKLSPVLSVGATPVIKNLKLLTGAKLEITNDAFIKIAGAITSDAGAITANEGNIELNAPSNGIQNISGSVFKNRNLKRLIVSSDVRNSATAGDTLNILFGLSFGNANADLNTGNNITLRSTPASTASVGKLQTGNTVTGQFNVERYIKYFQNWNMLSAPIRDNQSVYSSWQENGAPKTSNGYGTQITAPTMGAGIDATSQGNSLKYYDAATGNYALVNSTTTAPVKNKEGYYIYVRGDRGYGPGSAGNPTTLRSKGEIYTDAIKPSFSYSVAPNNFIAIGNPYASAVDLMKLAIPNPIETNFYFWDPTLGGAYQVGGYQTVAAATGGLVSPGSSLYLGSKKYPNMQSGQAIFVRTLATATNPTTISFNEDMKADSSLLVSRGNHQDDQIVMLSTMIYSSNGDLADGNRVVFSTDYSNAVDRYDAIKITNGGINFGLLRNNKKLIVEARQPISATDTLHFNMSNLGNGTYKLGFSVQYIPAGNEAFLIDKFLQTRTAVNLSDSSFYSFTTSAVAASKASDRFMMVFKPAAGPLPVTITGISANRNTDRSIAIRWTVENEVNIEKYEVERSADGRNFTGIITAAPTNSNVYTKNDLSPLAADNFYRIKALTVGGYTQYSAIVKVAPLQELAAITVFPNPVIDQRTQVSFVNQKAGTYELKLYNQSGQLMQKEQVKVVGSNFVKTFVLNNNFAGGVYQLTILNPDGSSSTQQLIIK